MWTRVDVLLWLVYVSGVGRQGKRFGTSHFGPLQLTARAGHISDVKFIQVYRKLVSA